MALEKNLQDYLKSRKDVQSANKKLKAAKSKVSQLQSALGSAPEAAKAGVRQSLESARTALNNAQSEFNSIESDAKSFYESNKESIQSGIARGKTTKAKTTLEQAIIDRDRLASIGQSTVVLDKKIAELQGNIAGGFQPVPSAGGTASGEPNTDQDGKVKPVDFDALAKTAREFVKNELDNAGRLELANSLSAAGIEVPITGEYTEALTNAYKNAIGGAKSSWNAFKEYPTVDAYLNEQARQVRVLKAAGGGVGGEELPKPFGTQEIFNKSTAEGVIEDLYKTFTGKDASASEVNSLYKELLAEQKKLSSISKGTYKMVGGRRVLVQESGLDPRVFLENRIKQLPAYKESQAAKSEKIKIDLASTAIANGYNLETDFANDLPNWLDAISKGESIDKFKNKIRVNARRILPEAVRNQIDPDEDLSTTFSTYMSNIAKAKGVPVNTIRVQDVIPLAITDKGFADAQQFEVKKRSQAWWDGSPEGISVTTTFLNDTLKDFGLLGQGARTV
jgi:hypothetical protein